MVMFLSSPFQTTAHSYDTQLLGSWKFIIKAIVPWALQDSQNSTMSTCIIALKQVSFQLSFGQPQVICPDFMHYSNHSLHPSNVHIIHNHLHYWMRQTLWVSVATMVLLLHSLLNHCRYQDLPYTALPRCTEHNISRKTDWNLESPHLCIITKQDGLWGNAGAPRGTSIRIQNWRVPEEQPPSFFTVRNKKERYQQKDNNTQ